MATELPQKIMIKVRHKWVTTSEPSKRVVLVRFINNHNNTWIFWFCQICLIKISLKISQNFKNVNSLRHWSLKPYFPSHSNVIYSNLKINHELTLFNTLITAFCIGQSASFLKLCSFSLSKSSSCSLSSSSSSCESPSSSSSLSSPSSSL